MKRKNSKISTPVMGVGVVAIVCTTVLTVFATYAVVNKVNENADIAYAQTVNQYKKALSEKQDIDNATAGITADDVVTSDGKNVITEYTSDDLIQIDGEWYILSNLLDDASNNGHGVPITVDPDNTVSVSGSQYAHIENQEAVEVADSNEIPFFGNEYVVVDIDGTMVYLVKKGDTLSDVSGLVGYSVQELAENNCIKNVNLIYEGQTIRIPAGQEAIDYVKSHQTITTESDFVEASDAVNIVESKTE